MLRVRLRSKPRSIEAFTRLLPLLSIYPLIGKLWMVGEDGLRIRG